MSVTLAREELARIAPGRDAAVTIGKFDGVHRGHQHLIARLIERAREHDLASVVIVLYPSPATVLRPGTAVNYLTSLEERLELLRDLGPDSVGILPFTSEMAQLSPRAGDGEKVGSSAVRQALAAGDVEEVARLLGRPFSLRGPVVPGAHRGAGLGFPTANIAIGLDRALPAFGG